MQSQTKAIRKGGSAIVIAAFLCVGLYAVAWACSLLGDAVEFSSGGYPGGGTQVTLDWNDPYSASSTTVYAYGYNSAGQLSWSGSVTQSATPAGYGGQGFVIPSGVNIGGGIEVEAYQHTGHGTLTAQGSGAASSSCGSTLGGD